MRELDLQLDRVGLEVDEPPARGQLGQRLRAAVQVDDQVGRAVEALQLELAHPVAAAVVVQGVEGPAVGEAEAAHHARR